MSVPVCIDSSTAVSLWLLSNRPSIISQLQGRARSYQKNSKWKVMLCIHKLNCIKNDYTVQWNMSHQRKWKGNSLGEKAGQLINETSLWWADGCQIISGSGQCCFQRTHSVSCQCDAFGTGRNALLLWPFRHCWHHSTNKQTLFKYH